MSELNENERLLAIMENEKMTAREFATTLSISPATLSNITNGRNKPSLDLLQKASNRFRMISSDWLFLGIGPMYRQTPDSLEPVLFDVRPEDHNEGNQIEPPVQAISANSSKLKAQQVVTVEKIVERKIKKIMVFFDDGTFQEISNI